MEGVSAAAAAAGPLQRQQLVEAGRDVSCLFQVAAFTGRRRARACAIFADARAFASR